MVDLESALHKRPRPGPAWVVSRPGEWLVRLTRSLPVTAPVLDEAGCWIFRDFPLLRFRLHSLAINGYKSDHPRFASNLSLPAA